jgi:hypothetical protein
MPVRGQKAVDGRTNGKPHGHPPAAPGYSAGAMTTPRYRKALRALLTPAEHRLFSRLDSPQKIQDFLDKVPANFEPDGDTARSPRGMLKARVAHCSEAAVFAAAVLLYHGQRTWLMDLRALPSDQDHIVTLFKRRGLWGAISKTNHAILRWRDPIYASVRELAMSYAHEYCLPGGKKSMLSYSRPFSLTRYPPKRWVISPDDLDWLLHALDLAPHVPVAPSHAMHIRRRSARVELEAQEVLEWPRPGKGNNRKKF